MPGFSNTADIYLEMLAGKSFINTFRRVTSNGAASAAGRWHELVTSTGGNGANALGATAGTGTALTSFIDSPTAGFFIPPFPSSGATSDKYFIQNIQAQSSTSTVPIATAVLCDFVYYYGSLVVTGTPTTLSSGTAVPRYADGKGLMAICSVQTVNGATQPALTFTFTDDTNASTSAVMTSPVASAPVSTLYLNNGSPFFPLTGSASGIKSVASYTLATGTTGTVAVFLVKPLIAVPIVAQNIFTETDLFMQMPTFPQIQYGSCLQYIIVPGGNMAASSVITSQIQYAWA